MRRNFFNMVEVALALAVIGIGLAGIMSLFPVGIQSSRDAISESYAANAGEQMLRYFQNLSRYNWSAMTSLPTSKPADRGSAFWKTDDWGVAIKDNIYNPPVNGIFGVKQGLVTGNNYDFVGEIRVWKTPIEFEYLKNTTTGATATFTDAACAKAMGLNIELSWPVAKPYDARKKSHFYLEVHNEI